MIIIREKSYAENEEKKGMSTGAKVGLGVLGTVASAAAFAGARNGMLGKTLMTKSNQAWGNLGKRIGSEGMMKSASSNLGSAKYQELIAQGKTRAQALTEGKKVRELARNTWNNNGTISSTGTNIYATPKATT